MSAVEGLRDIAFGENFSVAAGSKFALPNGFDSKRYASKWATEDLGVQEAEQETVLPFAQKVAEGWRVYLAPTKSPDGKKDSPAKPVVRVAGKSRFVLMFRPKALQQALNGLYAQESRRITNQEIVGESVSVGNQEDPGGVLSNQDLRHAARMTGEDVPTPLPPTTIRVNDPNTASTIDLQ